MRKCFIVLSLSLAFEISYGQTYVYHPFPDSNAVWTEVRYGIGSGCNVNLNCNYSWGSNCQCVMDIVRQDSLGGDTIIQSTTYKKIHSAWIKKTYYSCNITCNPGFIPDTLYEKHYSSYAGAIRQDKNLHKIYIAPFFSWLSEEVLYDFNLNIGDTLPPMHGAIDKSNYVYNMDSVLIGGNYYKRFIIGNISGALNYVSIIEGIGSTFGLLEPLVVPFEYAWYLKCVNINSKSVYPDTTTVCDNLFTGIKDYNAPFFFSVLPNPSTGKITVKSEIALKKCVAMDVLGNTVYSAENIQSTSFDISFSQLSNGIYFLKVINVHNIEQGCKVVVEH